MPIFTPTNTKLATGSRLRDIRDRLDADLDMSFGGPPGVASAFQFRPDGAVSFPKFRRLFGSTNAEVEAAYRALRAAE